MGTSQSSGVYYSPPARVQERYAQLPQFFPYRHLPLSVGNWENAQSGRIMKRSFNTSYVLCGITNRNPPNNAFDFSCTTCRSKVYDGGLCKKALCKCGKTLLRSENEAVS